MICLYAKDEDDFTTNGLLVLDRYCASAEISEDINGIYGLEAEFTSDDFSYVNAIANDMIIRAPAPVRPTIYLRTLSTHKLYTANGRVYMLSKASSSGKRLRSVKAGDKLIWISTSGGYYYASTMSGLDGYVLASQVTYYGEDATTADGYQVTPVQSADQLFRIYQISHTLDGVQVKANHIFYDLRNNYVQALTITNSAGSSALTSLLDACVTAHPFSGYSDVTETATIDASRKNPVDVLMSDEGFLQYNAQLLRDNFNVYLSASIGENRGALIAYGKNITGMTVDIDTESVITRLIPIGYQKDGTAIYLDAGYVDSEHLAEYGIPRVAELDCKDVKVGSGYADAAAVKVKLAELAAAEFAKGIDLPIISVDIDYVDMDAKSVGVLQAGLRTIYLGDTVAFRHANYEFDFGVKAVGYTWDALRKEYTALKLSNVNSDLRKYKINKNLIPPKAITSINIAPGAITSREIKSGTVTSSIDTETVFPEAAAPPTGPSVGQLWHDSANQVIKRWNGSMWVAYSVSETAFEALTQRVALLEG